tara:strand:+ start:239 stop:874 length:636 start_codon:yes stop_codon:yes gene_type:complete
MLFTIFLTIILFLSLEQERVSKKFQRIAGAYAVLIDEEKRKQYDRSGVSPFSTSPSPSTTPSTSSPFSSSAYSSTSGFERSSSFPSGSSSRMFQDLLGNVFGMRPDDDVLFHIFFAFMKSRNHTGAYSNKRSDKDHYEEGEVAPLGKEEREELEKEREKMWEEKEHLSVRERRRAYLSCLYTVASTLQKWFVAHLISLVILCLPYLIFKAL